MADDDQNAPAGRHRRAGAFAVHILTASGGAWALLALLAATERDWPQMFAWLGVALIVDGIDGTFARLLRAREVLPRWSGDVLDFVVDILTYVFVPAYALVAGGLLPPNVAVALGALVVCTGCIYFADRNMKTVEYYFLGFPALWNLVAFYLFLLRPAPWLSAAAVLALCAFTFVPAPFAHPLRVGGRRALNVGLLVAWTLLAGYAIAESLQPSPWVVLALCALLAFYAGASVAQQRVRS